ncbi:MAG: hypothetical protein AAB837_02970 [Patescibacteria group bacterium]
MIKFTNKNNFLLLILFFIFCFANKTEAAILKLASPNGELGLGQEIKIDLIIDTENEQINAVGGRIVFPENLFEPKEIKDGNSIVSLWTEKPQVNENGAIIFSGIIPGGVSIQNGLLFSVVLEATKEGSGAIAWQNAEVLKNDGLGTSAEAKISNFQFIISKQTPISQTPISEIKDTEPPEGFKPAIGSDPEIFGGQYFLVFITQDKNSSIDHYEVREGFWGKYATAESPYLIKDQSLGKKIYIKAIDKASNEKVVKFKPENALEWYQHYLLFGIMPLAAAAGFLFKKLWLKFIK